MDVFFMKTVMLNIRGGTFEHLLLLRLILCEIFYLCLFCWNRLKQTRNRCPHCRGYSADFSIRSLHLDSLAGWEPKEIRGGKCTVCVRVCGFESTLYAEPNSVAVPIFLSVLTKEIDCLYVIFSSQSSFASSVSLYFFFLHHTCITGN